eukprot:scaffold646154_cov24-Prasinocladus_malaysianus.AAC.1
MASVVRAFDMIGVITIFNMIFNNVNVVVVNSVVGTRHVSLDVNVFGIVIGIQMVGVVSVVGVVDIGMAAVVTIVDITAGGEQKVLHRP